MGSGSLVENTFVWGDLYPKTNLTDLELRTTKSNGDFDHLKIEDAELDEIIDSLSTPRGAGEPSCDNGN